jgi:hypothetical protein
MAASLEYRNTFLISFASYDSEQSLCQAYDTEDFRTPAQDALGLLSVTRGEYSEFLERDS